MKIIRPLILFGVGGLAYNIIELIFRGHTHWTMFIVGGICFIAVGLINEILSWETPFVLQCLVGGLIITLVEFISGCIVNILLGWNVWDYSNFQTNLFGQICIPFTLLWILISAPAIILDDCLRCIMGEEKPRYKF